MSISPAAAGSLREVLAPQPLYFGPPGARLFGCHHRPTGTSLSSRGVLLCQPTGHEYMACYRAVRQLAIALARAGYHVLRFDFAGVGDSDGHAVDGRPTRWVHDIDTAEQALKGMQPGDVSLVALRAAAPMALMHTNRMTETVPPRLVLWEPVTDGGAFVTGQLAAHRERFGSGREDEVLGFPFPRPLRRELESIAPVDITRKPADRVLIVESTSLDEGTRQLAQHLTRAGSLVERRAIPTPPFWQQPDKTIVPALVIQQIVAWMRESET